MASSISISEFKEVLSRYPAVLKAQHANAKPDSTPIEELDKFRYVDAPVRFSKKTGNTMTLEDVQKLVEWKLSHGTTRPALAKQVASNSDDLVEEATKDGFAHYASNPDDIKTVLTKLSKPLMGIGPAAASLLLAVHDPDHVIFFSDEVYQWLVAGGKKVTPKYNIAEYEEIFTKGKALQTKLKVSPIDIEKAAYVLIKENEPAKKESSGRGRGRPPKPESEKKVKKPTVPGRGRGRPPGSGVSKAKAPKAKVADGKGRGRPAKAKAEAEDNDNEENEEEEKEEVKTPAGKRKVKDDGSAKRSGKKAKA